MKIIELLAVLTMLISFIGCAQNQRTLPPTSPVDLKTENSIPAGEAAIFGRVNVVINNEPFIWDNPSWDKFYLFLISNSGSKPIVYTLVQDGTFSWNLPPGHYTITSFKWLRNNRYFIRPVFASFTVSKQLDPVYIGELVINFIQTGPSGYSQKIWGLPRQISGIYVADNYQHALNQQQFNLLDHKT